MAYKLFLFGTLTGVLSAASLHAADPVHLEQVRLTHDCRQCDLTDADLRGRTLRGADLRETHFDRANLYKAELRGARLKGASFRGANLSGANLQGATGANLSDAFTDEWTVCPSGVAGPCR